MYIKTPDEIIQVLKTKFFSNKKQFPIKLKITLPYLILALLLAIGISVVAIRLVFENVESRYSNQLIATGKLVSDGMAERENAMLETFRILANTDGVAAAIIAEDAELVRELTFGVIVNAQADSVEVLSRQAELILGVRHKNGGNLEDYDFVRGGVTNFADWSFVSPVINVEVDTQGDKYSGYVKTNWGPFFYISGPVYADDGSIAGAILVGTRVEKLALSLAYGTASQVTIYDQNGLPIASTFQHPVPIEISLANEIILNQESSAYKRIPSRRDIQINQLNFSEIIGPWENRDNQDMGLIGTSLIKNIFVSASVGARLMILLVTILAIFLVILIGINIARIITTPLILLVDASKSIADGNLQAHVPVVSNDELATLTDSFNRMVDKLYLSKIDLVEAYDKTLEGWSRAHELRDRETQGHSERVSKLTIDFASLFPFSSEEITHIRRGAILHDIGKMGVPDEILQKKEGLSDEEWDIMRMHPKFAYDMLKDIQFLLPSLEIPYCHHEYWDGSGYPRGLMGEEIPLSARVFSVIDAWDAMTTERPYHRKFSKKKALEIITSASETQFDPNVVEKFIQFINLKIDA